MLYNVFATACDILFEAGYDPATYGALEFDALDVALLRAPANDSERRSILHIAEWSLFGSSAEVAALIEHALDSIERAEPTMTILGILTAALALAHADLCVTRRALENVVGSYLPPGSFDLTPLPEYARFLRTDRARVVTSARCVRLNRMHLRQLTESYLRAYFKAAPKRART